MSLVRYLNTEATTVRVELVYDDKIYTWDIPPGALFSHAEKVEESITLKAGLMTAKTTAPEDTKEP